MMGMFPENSLGVFLCWQNLEDGSKFCLIEVYTGDAAAGRHPFLHPKVDGFAPHTQTVNLRRVCQGDRGLRESSRGEYF